MNEPKSWWEIMEDDEKSSEDEPTLLEEVGEDKYEKLRQMSIDDEEHHDTDDN